MLRDAELWPVSDGGSYFEQYLATMARRTATLLLLAAWLAGWLLLAAVQFLWSAFCGDSTVN